MKMSEQSEQFNISMPPDVWGPIFWDAMHIASLAYPVQPTEADKAGAKAFFESLASVIPCPICREHYSAKSKESPIALESKGELIYWVWDIHNQVNIMLNKPTVTIEQFMERMRNLGSIRGTKTATNIPYIAMGTFVGILIGAGAFYAYQKYLKD
jgi:hypothetical protein